VTVFAMHRHWLPPTPIRSAVRLQCAPTSAPIGAQESVAVEVVRLAPTSTTSSTPSVSRLLPEETHNFRFFDGGFVVHFTA